MSKEIKNHGFFNSANQELVTFKDYNDWQELGWFIGLETKEEDEVFRSQIMFYPTEEEALSDLEFVISLKKLVKK